MRKSKTYTLSKFIENMEKRVNMSRHDKVEINFADLELVYNGELRTVYNYELGDKVYTVYINKETVTDFDGVKHEYKAIGVLFNGYDYDIGEIDTSNREDTVTAILDCDVKWY